MFLADEARWEHMATPSDDAKTDQNLTRSELEEKYLRLQKAKEACDVRILELYDKTAELSNLNNSKALEITKLISELQKAKDKRNTPLSVNADETSVEDLNALMENKSQGHSRTSPGSQPQAKPAQERHICKICKFIFDSLDTLRQHMETHSLQCEKCSFRTQTNQQMTSHIQNNHKEITFQCEKCSFRSETNQQMLSHTQNNHKEPIPMKCSFCPATFIEKKNIYAHRQQYHKSYKACINIPNCSFKELCSFNHNPITEGAFICYQCGEEYMIISDLMMHKKNAHKKELCTKFQTGKCTKNPCWYTHEMMAQPTPPPSQSQGFRQDQPSPVPPAWGRQQPAQVRQNPTPPQDPMMSQIMEMIKQQQTQINQMNQALQALASNESTESI